jgi:hypothetical protein
LMKNIGFGSRIPIISCVALALMSWPRQRKSCVPSPH